MVASPDSNRDKMKKLASGFFLGAVVSLVLFSGGRAVFRTDIYSEPYAQVIASPSSADLTLFSGNGSELRHSFHLIFEEEVGNPRFCSGEEDNVCVEWTSAKLLVTNGPKEGLRKVTISSSQYPFEICFPIEGQQLYGGPVLKNYPSQLVELHDVPYITGDTSRMGRNLNVLERYWYTSGGLNLHVDPNVPLFLSQNNSRLCLAAKNEFPYSKDVPIKISYTTCENAKNAKDAIKCFFPTYKKSLPPREIISYPIWSTWVAYKTSIDQNKTVQFESDIRSNGFNASIIEIDDAWETCYGSLSFNPQKFPNPKSMVDQFHSLGLKVTIWVHPFVGPGCTTNILQDYEAYLFKVPNGSVGITSWWNGVGSLVDFLKPKTTEWFVSRLDNLKYTYGIDGFKFDAGEAAYIPGMSLEEEQTTLHEPNMYTTNYVKMASHFGTLGEVRVGAESIQFKIMQRLQDTNSVWEAQNWGLRSVIKSVLQLSLLGYGAILPDMVGGNCYNNHPSKELFIRWVQVNTFLPVFQFSLAPWSFDEETVNITKKFTSLHFAYTDRILRELNNPNHQVINPIWWISPNDRIALVISSEFLLGEDLLVAPVLRKGDTSRDIYLPIGNWRDENTGAVYTGPITLKNYSAPLDVLPYFERIGKF